MKNRIITRLAKQNIIANIVSEFKDKWVVDGCDIDLNWWDNNTVLEGVNWVIVKLPEKNLYDKSPEEVKEIVKYFGNPDKSDLSMFPLNEIAKCYNEKLKEQEIQYIAKENDFVISDSSKDLFTEEEIDYTLKNNSDPLFVIFTLNDTAFNQMSEKAKQSPYYLDQKKQEKKEKGNFSQEGWDDNYPIKGIYPRRDG